MRRRLAAGITLGIGAQLSSIGLLLTSAWLIVRAAEHPPVMYLMVAIVSVRFFGVGRAVFHYGERLLTHDVVLATTTEERVRTYRELDRVTPLGLHRQRRGDIISRVVGDVDTAQERLLRLRLPWVYALVSSGCVVTLFVLIDPTMAAILTAHIAFCAAVARLGVARFDRSARARDAELRGAMAADSSSLVLASRDLVAYGSAERVQQRTSRTIGALATLQRSGARIVGAGTAFVLASTGITIVLLALVSSGTPAVLAGVVLLAPVALIEPLESLTEAERLRPGITAARRRLDELAAVPTPVDEPRRPHPLPTSSSLAVRDLVVGWDRPVAAPVSFVVERGDIVGVTGPSGVGKSTLAMTLVKLIASRSGTITLGGLPVADLTGPDVRTRIGMTGQDDVVFDTTIRENLRVADPRATDPQMLGALDRAGLGAFVRRLPRTLDTPVGESGCELSGGERQRLAIARLLLAGPDILVLDEPTEHLDRPAADQLLTDVADLAQDHGVLIISHSAEALSRCHRVVHLTGAGPGDTSAARDHGIEPADVRV